MIRAIGAYTLSECMEIMARLVAAGERESEEKRGVVFCEDRLTLIAERALTAATGGSFRSYVTTYARALKSRARVLTKQGSVVAIDGIVSRLQKQGKLKRFTRGLPRGTARGLYETISQIAASSVDPETLENGAAQLESGILKDKINDLSEIYAAYKQFLKENAYVDESGYLALLPEYLKSTGELRGADVYFLCYGSFTAQAAKTLKAAFETAENVTGIFCFGKEDLYTGSSRRSFLRAAEEYYAEKGDTKSQVQISDMGAPLGGAAEVLRRGIFDPSSFSGANEPYKTDAIRIFEAEDKTDEMARVAAEIKKRLAQNPALRYRDFAVLVSDTKAYAQAVKKAFSEYRLPCFFDEKRTLRSHPLSAFLLACFETVRTGFSPDAVDAFLQNPFFTPPKNDTPQTDTPQNDTPQNGSPQGSLQIGVARASDEYRNYLLKYANFRGGAKKEIKKLTEAALAAEAQAAAAEEGEEGEEAAAAEEIASAKTQAQNISNPPPYDEASLNMQRARLLEVTGGLKRKARGEEYCAAVREILEKAGAEARLAELCESVKDVALKDYLERIGSALEKLLAETEELLRGREMSVSEFQGVLSDGLDATEISLIPVKTDAVFVGDLTDSRIEKVQVLFAAGMNENVPKTTSDTALISDRELEKLAEVKAKIEPAVAEVNLRGREDAALNLCTFEEAAYFSYALPADGSEPAVSEVLRYVNALFCTKNGMPIRAEKARKEEDFAYECSAPAPALRKWYLLREEDEEKQIRYGVKCNSLEQALAKYESEIAIGETKETGGENSENADENNAPGTNAEWARAAAVYESEAENAFIDRGEDLFFRGGKISPSALESYFTCPFRHFLQYGLKLKEREEQSVMATDSGNFIHELLEKTAKQFEETTGEAEMRAKAEEIGAELLKKPPYSYSKDTPAGEYAQSRLLSEGVEAAAAAYRQVKGSLYRVAETEKCVETPDFRGKIDRVDVSDHFVRIIDYKTGTVDDSVSSYYTGRKIQLEMYMAAAKGDKIPAGVFYFPASLSFSDESDKPFRMRGFFVGDQDALTAGDPVMTAGEKGAESEFFASKNGETRNTHSMDRLTFLSFIEYSEFVAEGARKELKAGYIGVSPSKYACAYCPYGGACGFHPDKSVRRAEELNVRPEGVASIVNEILESGCSPAVKTAALIRAEKEKTAAKQSAAQQAAAQKTAAPPRKKIKNGGGSGGTKKKNGENAGEPAEEKTALPAAARVLAVTNESGDGAVISTYKNAMNILDESENADECRQANTGNEEGAKSNGEE